MPNTSGDIQRKAGFFHSLGKVITEDANSAGNEKYKSAHNVRSGEVWMDPIPYTPTSASASQNADGIIVRQIGSASGISDVQNVYSEPVYLYPLTQTNYQTWFMDIGTPSPAVDGFVPSDGWVKPLISPVDVPNNAGAPSFGFNLVMYRPNGTNTISYNNAYYEVDYFAGLIRFQIGNTPVEGTGLGFTFNSSAFQALALNAKQAYIQNPSTGGPRAIAWQYVGQKLSNYSFSGGGTVSFEDSATIGFTQSGVTYSAYVLPGSLTASSLNTGLNGGATAGYALSVDNNGNFSWVNPTYGSSGTSGLDGSSGTSGLDGSSGTSGVSGTDGSSGTSGIDGSSGTSGIDGSSGTSGIEGSSGTSGYTGSKYVGTSSTVITVPNIGNVVDLQTQPGLAYSYGQTVVLFDYVPSLYVDDYDIGGGGYIIGEIDSYDPVAGTMSLVVNYSENVGSSYSLWWINISGRHGDSGSSGSSGTSGIDGSSGTSGIDGSSGTSGVDGSSGTSGSAGTSGQAGDRYRGTSSTTIQVPNPGNVVDFIVQPGLAYSYGQSVVMFDYFPSLYVDDYTVDAGGGYMIGEVDSYDPISGTMSIVVNYSESIGNTYSLWWVNLTGRYQTITGSAGSSGTSGVDGSTGSSGTSGIDGSSGTSGTEGSSGTSGISGSAGTSGTSADGFTFSSDLTVSLSSGKTFGKYLNGDTIPATGKTPAEVIQMAIVEAINPTVSLTSPTSISFNQTAISNVLNFSYTINSLGATASSTILEWRRNNSGSWTTLVSSTSSTTYTHSLTDTNYNAQPFNYRYVVIDSQGASSTATLDITPVAYVAPSISLTVTGNSITSPETNANRELGNVDSNVTGSITRNSSLVDITSYTLQYSLNNSTWTDIGTSVSFGPGSGSITPVNHNDLSLVSSTTIYYRLKVIDDYQTYISSFVTGGNKTITFNYLMFYGPGPSTPSTSSDVRSLPSKRFASSGSFTLYTDPDGYGTGNDYRHFTVAIPASYTLPSSGGVIDLDALNTDISSAYISGGISGGGLQTFNVDDYAANSHSYKVYTMVNASPYTSGGSPAGNHRHSVTI